MSATAAAVQRFEPPRLSPRIHHLPGASRQSQLATHDLLAANHAGFDIFEQNQIFHNHLSHHLLTAFALGGSPSLLHRIFKHERQTLVPLDPAEREAELTKHGKKVRTDVPALTADNWADYLGVQDAYARYLAYFERELELHGVQETLDRYLFSPEANAGEDGNRRGPRMLIRLVAGVIHPFIQIGFGAEFESHMIIAEGLAEAAVHSADTVGGLFPDSWPYPAADSGLAGLRSEAAGSTAESLTALEVYKRFVDDKDVVIKDFDPDKMINARLRESHQFGNAGRMQALVASWVVSAPPVVDGQTEASEAWLKRKVDEAMVLNSLLACATGRLGKETRIDFFLMHLLTSSLFLPSILPLLPSFGHQKTLLETYMLAALHTALSRGRPLIDGRVPLSWPVHPVDSTKPDGNVWAEIVQRTLGHPDSHTIKTVRALLHLSTVHALDDSPLPGAVDASGNETFPGLGEADAEIFARMAAEVGRYMGWSEQSEEGKGWDRSALGWDAAWQK